MNLLHEVGEDYEERLKAALEERAIVVIADSAGKTTFANDEFCAISGYASEELLGAPWFDNLLTPSPNFLKNLPDTIRFGTTWFGEVKSRSRDGSVYWIATTVLTLLDANEQPQQYAIVGTNVTDRRRIETELAEKSRLQTLLAQLSSRFVGLATEQIDGAIEEALRLTVEALHLDRGDLWQLLDGRGGPTLTHQWPGTKSNGSNAAKYSPFALASVMKGEILCFSTVADLPPAAADDAAAFTERGIRSSVAVPLVVKGVVFGALGFSTTGTARRWTEDEVTELKLISQIVGNSVGHQRAERREEQLRGELAHAMRIASVGELASALAHELNQPLASILSNAQAARRFLSDGATEELGAILDDIVRDNKRAGAVIHNLRGMVSKQPAIREECCINGLVCEVLELLKAEIIGEKITVNSTLRPGLSRVIAARVELQQVLVNLLLNAMHAMRDTPREISTIEIQTYSEGDTICVRIRDRGRGISPQRLSNIFDPFYSTKPSGLGMGLSICRRIVESHGGRIEARNCDDGGACFLFSLAAASREKSQQRRL